MSRSLSYKSYAQDDRANQGRAPGHPQPARNNHADWLAFRRRYAVEQVASHLVLNSVLLLLHEKSASIGQVRRRVLPTLSHKSRKDGAPSVGITQTRKQGQEDGPPSDQTHAVPTFPPQASLRAISRYDILYH